MAYGPEVLDLVPRFYKTAILRIDCQLSDKQWVNAMALGDEENPFLEVTMGGFASETDKKCIIAEYLSAGWGKVTVVNSEENGERPGMTLISLFKYPSENVVETSKEIIQDLESMYSRVTGVDKEICNNAISMIKHLEARIKPRVYQD